MNHHSWLPIPFGPDFNKFQKSIQEGAGFSFPKLFAGDLSKGELICLLLQSKIRKLWGKRTSALNFASVQILNFKHSTGSSVIYHDQIDIREQASTKVLIKFFILWNFLFRAGQSLRWPPQQATESRQANKTSECFWLSFPVFPIQ